MLRQIFIIHHDEIIYSRTFGKAFTNEALMGIYPDIKKDAFSKLGEDINNYDYYKHKISYIAEKVVGIVFIFISGLTDDLDILKRELIKFKKEFLNIFGEFLNIGIDSSMIEVINPTTDAIHRNLRPKISLIGFSGVGKTTITRLIRAEEIPVEHIPTITGEVATIKIGKLLFNLWDFAGQEQFSFLWNKFIKGSDAVLLITDSSLYNIEKSKFFLELINQEAPFAHSAVIANKQDLPDAYKVSEIERIFGLKTYSMIATDPDNRSKMIQIIADILDMSASVSPLLKPILDRDTLISEVQTTLESGEIEHAAKLFDRIADICLEIGDDSLGNEFYQKALKLKEYIASTKGYS